MKKALTLLYIFILSFVCIELYAQNALDFDGTDDKVDCGNDTSVQVSGKAITLEAWIYPTAWKTNAFDGNVINKEYNLSNYGYMLRVGAAGKLNFAIGDGTWREITTGTILSLNTWQHLRWQQNACLFKWYNCRFTCGCHFHYQNAYYEFNVGSTFNLYAFLSRFD